MTKTSDVRTKKVQINFFPREGADPRVCQDDVDLWSCNNLHMALPEAQRIHSWFQIHRPEDLHKEDRSHLRWIRLYHPFAIYMMRPEPQYPSAVQLPVDELKALWSFPFPPSFASSFSWMVALAIYQQYTHIHLENVDLRSPREAFLEAPNLMAWLGIASQRGIVVTGKGRLFEPCLYGIEERMPPHWVPIDVAQDLIIDQNLATRSQFREWDVSRRYME